LIHLGDRNVPLFAPLGRRVTAQRRPRNDLEEPVDEASGVRVVTDPERAWSASARGEFVVDVEGELQAVEDAFGGEARCAIAG
jgi:hypothetical protein